MKTRREASSLRCSVFTKSLADFLERQIRLFCHEIKQPLLVRLERRATVTGARFGPDVAGLAPPIEPTHCCGGCKIGQTRDLPPAVSLLDHRNRTLPHVFRVPLAHGFPPSVSTEHSNLICATAGIPPWQFRFTSIRNRSSA